LTKSRWAPLSASTSLIFVLSPLVRLMRSNATKLFFFLNGCEQVVDLSSAIKGLMKSLNKKSLVEFFFLIWPNSSIV
jgi:hypothetical protein